MRCWARASDLIVSFVSMGSRVTTSLSRWPGRGRCPVTGAREQVVGPTVLRYSAGMTTSALEIPSLAAHGGPGEGLAVSARGTQARLDTAPSGTAPA